MDAKTNSLLGACLSFFLLLQFTTGVRAQTRTDSIDQAAAYHKAGTTFIVEAHWDSAVHYTQLAAAAREVLFADSLNLNLGKSNFNAGAALFNRSDFADARSFYERALVIYTTLDLPTAQRWRVPYTHLKLGEAIAGTGDFEIAKDQIKLALGITQAPENKGLDYMAKIQADCYQYDQAEKNGDYVDEFRLTAKADLASVYNKLNDYKAAEASYAIIIQEYAAYGDDQNQAIAANNLGDMRTRMGDFIGAERALAKGKAAAQRANIPQYLAQVEDHQGSLWLARGYPAKAAAAHQRAQAILLPEYAPANMLETPPIAQLRYASNKKDLFLYLIDQARALDAVEGKGAEKARALSQLYRTGDALLDDLRQQQSGQASKFFWREKTATFYEAAIRLCHELDRPEDAFFFFEKSKAVLLYESILGSDALRALPDSLRQRERLLARSVTTAQSTLSSANDAGRTQALQSVISAQSDLSAFRQQLRNQFPRYRSLTENVVVPQSNDFYAEVLQPADQTLVHFFFGPEQTYALKQDEAGLETYHLGNSDSLQTTALQLLTYFSKPTDIQNDPAGYAAAAFAAYQVFLSPLSLPDHQSLLLIPDGPLTYLPFPALLTEVVTDANALGNLPYLLRRHPVAYGHSASILSRQRTTNSTGNQMVAFAPFADGSAKLDYPTLSFSEDELQQVTSTYQVDLFMNEAATLTQFREKAGTANVLHLSTHAFASADAGTPLIAFYDQPLFLQEVYHQDLGADLVVLSACQTNIGKLARGEGVLGLGRGFVQAGAGSVIASLWNVNARAGGRVLNDFYQTLGQGATKGMALHRAQLSYLDDETMRDVEKSPYLWAGLTYYGTETVLELASARRLNPLAVVLVGGIILGFGGLWISRRFQRNNSQQ